MAVIARIVLNQLSITLQDKPLFCGLTLSFLQKKYGIVGRNGVGKSTLLKLIAGELPPSAGSVQVEGKIAYFSQETLHSAVASVADALEVTEKLQALQRIAQGSLDQHDYALIGDDWRLPEKIQRQLAKFALDDNALDRSLHSLSGGQRARLFLAKVFLEKADYLILDEPTNNLDGKSRRALYQEISKWPYGLIVVSHDRELLNLMDNIVEISQLGVHIYGGAYEAYLEQKNIEQAAAQKTVQAAKQAQDRVERLTQERWEKHQRAQAKGRKMRKAQITGIGKIKNRIELNSAQGGSERTQRKINLQAERRLTQADTQIQAAQKKIEQLRPLDINLTHTQVPNGKMILEIKELFFRYPQQERPVIANLSLRMQGPERLALLGDNGSGKTTLVKLIMKQLAPTSGSLSLGTERVNYLDQTAQTLSPELSVLDNFLRLNPDISALDARYYLANFLFRNDAALTPAAHLSSGERLRANKE